MKRFCFMFVFWGGWFADAQEKYPSKKDTLFLEQVMVTAQKISERPLKIPMSVKAIGAKKIQQLQ